MSSRSASVFIVTTTDDSGPGSLRGAIEQANTAGDATIAFSIGSGPVVLNLQSPLPPLAFSGSLDGCTQPGGDGRPAIEINGASASEGIGLHIVKSGLAVQGLAITQWSADGVLVEGGHEVRLSSLYSGLRLDGVTAAGNTGVGVHIVNSVRSRVGGTRPEDAVVSAGNADRGIWIESGSHEARVWGSFVGTDAAGRIAIPNGATGLVVRQSSRAQIGGPGADYRNLLAGNSHYGLAIVGPEARGTHVAGNFIGTDVTGTASIGNRRSGVLVLNVPDCKIGGSSAAERNIISGNMRGGINVDGCLMANGKPMEFGGLGYTRGVSIEGNYIGTDWSGLLAVPNAKRGILLNYCQENLVFDNVIAANGEDGVLVLGPKEHAEDVLIPSDNRVFRNRIGTSADGATPMGNGRHGIFVQHGRRNVIGGDDPADANIIKHNAKRGVTFRGLGFDTNQLRSNIIESNGLSAFYQAA